MKTILYVDGCLRRERSRTEKLAKAYLRQCSSLAPCRIETIVLEESGLSPLNEVALTRREAGIAAGDFRDDLFRCARVFAAADEVVFAVPYWDFSFPAHLKVYLEHLCICGLTFRYSPQGVPVGLTRIKRVTYLTTAGGFIGPRDFGCDYVKGLMQGLFGIEDFQSFRAEGLDIEGNDPQAILDEATRSLARG